MKELEDMIPTRQSLLCRLRDWNDQESWRDFFETYWKLIYKAAMKSGLSDAEAQDVVQETVISVLKNLKDFEYNTEKGSFKGWLLRLTSWRINDQVRKRQRGIESPRAEASTSTSTAVIDQVAGLAAETLETTWDEEWEKTIAEAAIDRVKKRVDPKLYQAFDLYVFKHWPVMQVARTLEINPGKVYMSKHRIGSMIKKEMNHLRTKPI